MTGRIFQWLAEEDRGGVLVELEGRAWSPVGFGWRVTSTGTNIIGLLIDLDAYISSINIANVCMLLGLHEFLVCYGHLCSWIPLVI